MKVYYIWRDKKEIKMKRSRKRKKNKTLSRSKKGLIILIIITVWLCVVTTLKKQEHYTANPGATAMNNRDYFEGLKDSHITKASSNFVVGLEGEVVQCVPTWEIAYASNSRNIDTVSIECCHPDETGIFNKKTYQSMVDLCAWLCLKFDLDENDVIRHYDVTGKICPKYFVENEDAWRNFKSDIGTKLKKLEEYQ